jgi:hypothetical protein
MNHCDYLFKLVLMEIERMLKQEFDIQRHGRIPNQTNKLHGP